MKIVVTGASGFIGAHLVMVLAKAGYEVTAVCGNNPAAAEVLESAFRVTPADLADPAASDALIGEAAPHVIIHAAAMARPEACALNPQVAQEVNVRTTRNLIAAATTIDAAERPLFLQISTDLVFDGARAPVGGFTEDHTPQPESIYAKTKRAAEILALEYNGPAIILRICLCYGRQIGKAASFLGWIRDSLAAGNEVRLFTDEWRTPLFVDDLGDAAKRVVQRFEQARFFSAPYELPPLLHIAGGERINRYQFGLNAAAAFGYPVTLVVPELRSHSRSAAPRAEDVSLCAELLRRHLGLEPQTTIGGLVKIAQEEQG